ncbi:MAG: HdeD family acid-resistance protein [Methyloligella sp. ZOD6]
MTSTTERHNALSEALAESWWALGLRGVFGIAFGLICLMVPGVALLTLVLLFSAYMLVDGVFAIIAGVRQASHGERWGLLIFEGVISIAAGVIAFLWPDITLLVFMYLIAFWAVLSGFLMLSAAFSLNVEHGRWWLALGGIASIVFGIALMVVPLIGAIVLTWWLGAYAIVFGILLLVLAFQLHHRRDATARGTAASKPAAPKRSTPARRSSSSRTAKKS